MRRAAATALILAGLFAPARAAQDEQAGKNLPNAPDLLFERAQMSNAAAGSTIRYRYLRRSGIAEGPYGRPIEDAITFTIEPGRDGDGRDIGVRMFSGTNRAAAGPFVNMPGNPILPLFLEQHLKGLAGLLGANPRYIKNAIRKGLREKASVSATRIDFEGRPVEGWRIAVRPFEGDPQAERMRGLDSLTYIFVTSPSVPGEIVSIEARAEKPDGGELLDEKVDYDQNPG